MSTRRKPYSRPVSCATAVILAGGQGTRLRSVIPDRAKVMAPVNGFPFLSYLFEQIGQSGFRKVILCTGNFADSVTSYFGDSYKGLPIVYSHEPEARGTGGALRQALEILSEFPVFVMNGDSFCDVHINRFIDWHTQRAESISMALVRIEHPDRFGSVQFDADRRLTGFAEKGAVTGPAWINAGMYLMEREFVESIPVNRVCSLEEEMFPLWIHQGIHGFLCEGRFLDIGTPESYRLAQEIFHSRDATGMIPAGTR